MHRDIKSFLLLMLPSESCAMITRVVYLHRRYKSRLSLWLYRNYRVEKPYRLYLLELRLSCILMSRGECHTPTVLSNIRVKPNVCVKIYHCVNGDVDTNGKGLEQFLAFVFVYRNDCIITDIV